MMKNILILAANDLAISFKNKTFLLILFIPMFVFVSLNLADGSNTAASKVSIGLIQQETYSPEITHSINAAEKLVAVTWLENMGVGIRLLKEHKIEGILTNNEEATGGLKLLVLKELSVHTIAIIQAFSALQKAAEGDSAGLDYWCAIDTSRRRSKRDFAYLCIDVGAAHRLHYSSGAGG